MDGQLFHRDGEDHEVSGPKLHLRGYGKLLILLVREFARLLTPRKYDNGSHFMVKQTNFIYEIIELLTI